MKRRLLFILPNLSGGGAERNIVNLAGHLSELFEVHLGLIRYTGELFANVPGGVRVHDLGGRLRFPIRLVALARRLAPCVVFSTIIDVNLAVLALKCFFPPTVRLIIRDAVMPLDLSRGQWYAFASRFVWRCAYAGADAVIVLTERCCRATREELGVDSQRLFLIPNAASEARVGRYAAVAREHGSTIRLVSIGRLERQKGHDLLIRCMPQVLRRYSDVRLTIFGDGSERDRLQRDIDRLHLERVVTLAGYVPDPMYFLSQADLFVLCSRFEGMSNAMLEALCCGVPVATTNNRENSADEFIADGKNGFLIDGGTRADVAQGLLRAIDGCRALDRDWISDDARRRFSFTKYLARYLDILNRVGSMVERRR